LLLNTPVEEFEGSTLMIQKCAIGHDHESFPSTPSSSQSISLRFILILSSLLLVNNSSAAFVARNSFLESLEISHNSIARQFGNHWIL
jgi:hypothetical protein